MYETMKLSIYVYAVHLYNSNENPIIISNYSKLFHSEWLHCTILLYTRSSLYSIEWVYRMNHNYGHIRMCMHSADCLFVLACLYSIWIVAYGRWIRKTVRVQWILRYTPRCSSCSILRARKRFTIRRCVALRCDMRRFIYLLYFPYKLNWIQILYSFIW